MSIKLNFYLNNTLVNPPKNWEELDIELNFDRDGNAIQQVSITDFDFVRENARTIEAYKTNGFLFEGIPFRIEVEEGANVDEVFNGYVDLTDNARFSSYECNVKAVEKENIDWLNSVADSFTFDYLVSIGNITSADYQYMPYVINSVPDYKESAIALVSAYIVIEQIKIAIEKCKDLIADLSNPLTTISAVVKASLLVIYLVGLLIALVKFIKDIVTMLIQPVKYHACMSVKTQLEKGCEYLGLEFVSSIFSDTIFEKAYIMPEKYYNPVNTTDNRILGYTTPNTIDQKGEFKGTFGDLIRVVKKQFNCKVVIQNGKLYLERRDYNITPPQYIVPDIYQPFNTTNADEFRANYYIHFDTDIADKNTLQEYLGTGYQVIIRPQIVTNAGYELMKGLEDVFIPLALAKRKTELTVPEKIIKAFLQGLDLIINAMISIVNALIQGINAVTGVINDLVDALDFIGININFFIPPIPQLNYSSLVNLIENRIDMLKIETDTTSKAKIFLMDLGTQAKFNKLTSGNETYLSANYLYNNFHYINSFIPTNDKPKGNQYLKYNFPVVNEFGRTQYNQIKNNNQVIHNGEDAIIESVKWNIRNQKCSMNFRVNTLLSSNFATTILEPNGQ